MANIYKKLTSYPAYFVRTEIFANNRQFKQISIIHSKVGDEMFNMFNSNLYTGNAPTDEPVWNSTKSYKFLQKYHKLIKTIPEKDQNYIEPGKSFYFKNTGPKYLCMVLDAHKTTEGIFLHYFILKSRIKHSSVMDEKIFKKNIIIED